MNKKDLNEKNQNNNIDNTTKPNASSDEVMQNQPNAEELKAQAENSSKQKVKNSRNMGMIEVIPPQPLIQQTLKEKIKNKFGSLLKDAKYKIPFTNKSKKFNWTEFEKNAKSEVLPDGTVHKIVAEINNIHLSYGNPATPGVFNKVLRGSSLKIYEGKVHAIIGESGSGKSVITSLLYGLAGSNAVIENGEIKLYNNNVENFSFKDWERSHYRGRVISAIFQNPMSTLNPTTKVGPQIMEGMLINGIVKNKREAYKRAVEFLRLTKIEDPDGVMKLYPHEMSGGMIQRVVIAAIVALEPKILVMDEPTTALDPTVQALVLDVVRELQQKLKIAIVFITHDLGVVASISDYISIMYAGQIIEEGLSEEILDYPQHPYTWGLISSMPDVNKSARLETIRGSVPSNLNQIKGDAFAVRNDYALERDLEVEPNFYKVSPTHIVKSALLDDNAPEVTPPELILKKWEKFLSKQENLNNSSVDEQNSTTQNITI